MWIKLIARYQLISFAIIAILARPNVACISRSPENVFPLPTTTETVFAGEGEGPPELDKDTVSVIEQTLIKTLIAMGKLKFHCPRTDGIYPDKMDCRKYYKCVAGNYTVHECEITMGFEKSTKSCLNTESVPLCQRVQRLDGHVCNSTGLESFDGQCEKFILCTGEAAFSSSCNHGDLFDQRLKLCLPEQEANCIIERNMSNTI